jgi:serine/threonine-protein kinase
MPVHRIPGGDKPRVYALTSEIDAWLRKGAPGLASGTPEAVAPEAPVVAVLPFVILAGDKESQYFGDGLADDVINALTRIPDLKVMARTSSFAFRGRDLDVRRIGSRLGASVLLEGSLRRAGSRIRVSAQLISTSDGCHLWSEIFDRDVVDVFAIQDEIADAIARALRSSLAARRPMRRATPDMTAYDLWLKGRSTALVYTPEAMLRAGECFQAALRQDASFAQPHLGMAEMAWQATEFGLLPVRTGLPQVRAEIDRALALDDSLGEAHALDGVLRGLLDFDWDAAGRSFERALAENPSSGEVRRRYAWSYLAPGGHLAEADGVLDELVRLDPLSPILLMSSGLVKFSLHDFDGAASCFRSALEFLPSLWWARYFLGSMALFAGDTARGMTLCEEALQSHPGPIADGARAAVSGLAGNPVRAQEILARLLRENEATPMSPVAIAWACIGAQDDRVFEWLGRCIDEREPVILHFPHMPIYDGLRADPRFPPLLRRMGLGRD